MPVIGCFQLSRDLPSIPANHRANSTSSVILVEEMETRDPAAEGQLSLRATAMADPIWRSVRSMGAQRGAVCEVRAINRTI